MKSWTGVETKHEALIERDLLHKNGQNEVFLLCCESFGFDEYRAHALLHEHHYYHDHSGSLTDLMLLLECARQAETYIVHKYEKQPLGTRFILSEWACEFTENFLPIIDLLNETINLKIVANNSRRIKKRLLSQSYEIDIYLGNEHLANVYMSVKYMTNDAYCIARKDKLIYHPVTLDLRYYKNDIIPERIFRRRESNVVISSAIFNENMITSILAVDMDNTAYFDHVQDHYPAMLLMEAGKQNCQIWIYNYYAGVFPILIEMKSKFFLYAELDKDVDVVSVKISSVSNRIIAFNVRLSQEGVDIAEMEYSFKVFYLWRCSNMEAVTNKVVKILVDNFGLNEQEVKANKELENLGVDSIIMIEIQLDLERAFDIKITDGDILPNFTVKDISDYIKNKG